MIPSRFTLAILLVTALVLLGSIFLMGMCINRGMSDGTCRSIAASFASHDVTYLPNSLAVPPARYRNIYEKYWIISDQFHDKHVGNKFFVNATTNLPVGEEVRCTIKPGDEYSHLKNASAADTTVQVIAGENGLNKITLFIDTAELVPEEYSHGQIGAVTQFGLVLTQQTVWLNAHNQTDLLLEAPVSYITLDPISDKQFGDSIIINATTNLPVGENVLVRTTTSFSNNETRESHLILPGYAGLNRTSVVITSSRFSRVGNGKISVTEEYNYGYLLISGGTTFSISAPADSLCTGPENAKPWIRINFVNSTVRGEPIAISGTTNLPEGKNLTLSLIESVSYHSRQQCGYQPSALEFSVRVHKGNSCVNTFSTVIDSTNTLPDEYTIFANCDEDKPVSDFRTLSILSNTTPIGLPDSGEETPNQNIPYGILPIRDVRREISLLSLGSRGGNPILSDSRSGKWQMQEIVQEFSVWGALPGVLSIPR